MTVFIAGALLLALLTAALLLWRPDRTPRPADRDDPNLGWYRQRRAELADRDEESLLEEVRLRLLEDGADATVSAHSGATVGRGPAVWLLPVVLVLAGLLYWRLGALEDVLIYRALETIGSEDAVALEQLATRIERRSQERPDNLQYLGLLGELQLATENYDAAARSYARLADAAPDSAQAQAQAAQSRFLAAGRRLDPQAQRYAERALALDPQQGMALGLLGMASFEAGAFGNAIEYWQRLQALEVEGSPGFQMLADVIAVARERLPGGTDGAPVAAEDGITVALALPPGAAIDRDAVVFVFARSPAAASRMPIAARRLTAGELPVILRLSDRDALAGQRLSTAGDVVITVQVSGNGQPGEDNAIYLGRSAPVAAAGGAEQVRVYLLPT